MRVSVLIPSYNYASMIGRCLASVLAQDYPDLEVVVSDDASTDGSEAVIRSFSDPRVVYERQLVNLGMTPNWRRCMEMATGQAMLLLGADDYLKPGMLAACAGMLNSNPNMAFCHTATEFFDDSGRVIGSTGAFQRSYARPGREIVPAFLRGKRVVNSSALFRRSFFERVGGWTDDYRNCMDADLWLKMLMVGDVGYVGRILTGYRHHAVTQAWTAMQLEEDHRFLEAARLLAAANGIPVSRAIAAPGPGTRGAGTGVRQWAARSLVRLPAPARFLIGDLAERFRNR